MHVFKCVTSECVQVYLAWLFQWIKWCFFRWLQTPFGNTHTKKSDWANQSNFYIYGLLQCFFFFKKKKKKRKNISVTTFWLGQWTSYEHNVKLDNEVKTKWQFSLIRRLASVKFRISDYKLLSLQILTGKILFSLACPTGQTVTVFSWGKAEASDKECVHMYVCPCVLVAYVWIACQRQCVVPVRGWGSAQWSTAVPSNCVPHCHPGTMMLTVIGDCVLHSSLLPPSLPSLAPVLHFYLAPLAAPGF